MWDLKESLESRMTPRYLGSLVQGIFSLKSLTGLTEPRRWLRRLENSVTVDLWVLIWILHFWSHGSRRAKAEFSFLTATPTLPDRTLMLVSSAQMEKARLGSVEMDGKSLIKKLKRVGPKRLPCGTPARMGCNLEYEFLIVTKNKRCWR
jgi:hypothetical protein